MLFRSGFFSLLFGLASCGSFGLFLFLFRFSSGSGFGRLPFPFRLFGSEAGVLLCLTLRRGLGLASCLFFGGLAAGSFFCGFLFGSFTADCLFGGDFGAQRLLFCRFLLGDGLAAVKLGLDAFPQTSFL